MAKQEDGIDVLMRHGAATYPPSRDGSDKLRWIEVRLREQLGGQRLYARKEPRKRA